MQCVCVFTERASILRPWCFQILRVIPKIRTLCSYPVRTYLQSPFTRTKNKALVARNETGYVKALVNSTRCLSKKCGKSGGKNLCAVLHAAKDLQLEERPIPEPKPNEVLLKMACVGICGTDVHSYLNGAIGEIRLTQPVVIGHEASGVVEKLGSCVKSFQVGDRVAIEPGMPCKTCSFCKQGRYNLCPDIAFCSIPPTDGNLCQYYVHAADCCFKLPDHVSLEEGALLEPLSIGVNSRRRGGVTLGSTVFILGAGPVGLCCLIVAKEMGASKVLIADKMPNRLEVAKQFGADCILQICDDQEEEETVENIRCLLCEAPNVTIDCIGFESSIRLGLQATRTGGVIVISGMEGLQVCLPITGVTFREVDVRGLFCHCNSYPPALALAASGKVNVKPLITHNYKLADAVKAFENAVSKEGDPIKILIHCNK